MGSNRLSVTMASMSSAVKKSGIPAYRLNKEKKRFNSKISHFPHYLYLLSGFECQFVILSPIGTIDLGKVESLWEKVMDERAKSDAIGPGGGKVLDFNVLNYGIKMSSFLFTR